VASVQYLAAQSYFNMLTALFPNYTVWVGAELGVFQTPTTIEINGVTGDQQPAELGPNYRREETFSIHCKITVFAGEGSTPTDFLNRMDDTWTVFNAIEVAVANNPTLTQVVRYAECGDMDYVPTTTQNGSAMGQLTFEVRCSQRVTSLS